MLKDKICLTVRRARRIVVWEECLLLAVMPFWTKTDMLSQTRDKNILICHLESSKKVQKRLDRFDRLFSLCDIWEKKICTSRRKFSSHSTAMNLLKLRSEMWACCCCCRRTLLRVTPGHMFAALRRPQSGSEGCLQHRKWSQKQHRKWPSLRRHRKWPHVWKAALGSL